MKRTLLANSDTRIQAKNNEYQVSNDYQKLLFPKESFSMWQEQVTKYIDREIMKKSLFQFGWSRGKEMAKCFTEHLDLESISPLLHEINLQQAFGFIGLELETSRVELAGKEIVDVHIIGKWKEVSEVNDDVKEDLFNSTYMSDILSGVASGYALSIIGKEIYFKEKEGADSLWEGKLIEHWDPGEYGTLMKEDIDIKSYNQLEEERNQLQLVLDIQNCLTDELIRSNELNNVLSVLKKYISLPIIIENHKCQITDCANISLDEAEEFQMEFHETIEKWPIKKMGFSRFSNHSRLVTPIYLQNKFLGYCSFIYPVTYRQAATMERMLLARLASISALVYLNEKNIMDANSRTKGILFEKILANEYESKEQIFRELNLLHIDVSGKYHIAFLALKYSSYNEADNLSIFTSFYEEVIQFFQEKDYEVLQVQRANGILCFIPEDGDHIKLKNGPVAFHKRIKEHFPKIQCDIGVSTTNNDLKNVNSLMKEAMTAARFTTKNQPCVNFKELGILGILVHTQEEDSIKKIAEMELGAIYGQSEQQRDQMLTLYEFLINGGNLEQTSTKLKLSISGLRYRMAKIREILQEDLRDSKKQFDLLLALKALKAIGEF